MAGALKRGLLALVLALALTLGLTACGRSGSSTPRNLPAPGPGSSKLQEVAPPGAVQQLKSALDSHRPQLTLEAPADDSLLPPGPWTLEINLRDWPLVDAGPLGLGPHLVVQIDDREPIRITTAEPPAGDGTQIRRVRLPLDPLSPGSHRITAYAARPWGEAVKEPGASAQITVHRVAATPLTQPQAGEPQLLPVSPPSRSGSEPVLIDWLLRDAPLQHLRDGDTRWRLRVTVNGDSFQVDRQMPIWLKGFRPGSNAVVLELLDGLGEPIAPGLNTLVQEVILQPGERPIWSSNRLEPEVMAALLGDAPPTPKPTPAISKGSGEAIATPPQGASQAIKPPITPAAPEPTPLPGPAAQERPAAPPVAQPAPMAEPQPLPDSRGREPEPDPKGPAAGAMASSAEPDDTTSGASEPPEVTPAVDSGAPAARPVEGAGTMEPTPAETTVPDPQPADSPAHAEEPQAAPLLPPARSELNADGSVIRPRRQGLLSGLRQGAS